MDAQISFREKHEREKIEKKTMLSALSFFVKKSLSKPINMGSSLEDLDARNPTVKMVQDLDARF